MLVNYVSGEECRIAIMEDGKLEEYYQERASTESHVGNIYKGRVTNVEPNIQAAFVDFGLERNGFLHTSDLHPRYFPGKWREEFEQVGSKTPRHDRPPIQRCLKRGQEVLVQVLKEGIGNKGPTVTSYLSIPGRFLVMMPSMQRLGVSRKVDDDEARREMRDQLKALDPPEGFGFIIRTAGIGQTKTELKRDLAYLQRLWRNIEQKQKQCGRTGELYTESDLIIRTLRDVFTTDIDRVVIDELAASRRAKEFLDIANPRTKSRVSFYDDPVPLYHRFGVEEQIESISAREVPLRSGGSLVMESTEALVAIDVNSGKSRDARDAEANAYQTNLEAVPEICRQLRLRDLGGVVVMDLIDMRSMKNRKTIETLVRNELKKDRARTRIGPISGFGLLEMTRQRMRPSLVKSLYQTCDVCAGFGTVKSAESVVLEVMRRLALVMQRGEVAQVELTISPDVAFQLLNRKRGVLVHMEERYGKRVLVRVGGRSIDYVEVAAFDDRGGALPVDGAALMSRLPKPTETTFRDVDDPSLPEPEEASESMTYTDEDEEGYEDDSEESSESQGTGAAASSAVRTTRDAEPRRGSESRADSGDGPEGEDEGEDGQPRKKRRRRRRGGRGRRRRSDSVDEGGERNEGGESGEAHSDETNAEEGDGRSDSPESDGGDSGADEDRSNDPDAGDRPEASTAADNADEEASRVQDEPSSEPPAEKPKRRRRRSRSKKSSEPTAEEDGESGGEVDAEPDVRKQEADEGEGAGSERDEQEDGGRDDSSSGDTQSEGEGDGRRRRRRRRRGRGRRGDEGGSAEGGDEQSGGGGGGNDGGGGAGGPSGGSADGGGDSPSKATTSRGYSNKLLSGNGGDGE